MSSKQPSESKKSIKRRLNSNPKLTAEELTKKILFFLIENLISFDKIENIFFKNFLNHSVNENSSFLPDPEVLLHLTNEIYNDYQEYFKNYFATQPNLKISISCHKWDPINEINPYMFINAHYINENYKLCELSLSLFEFNSINLSNFLIRDTILKNFKNKVNFVTTNYEFDEKSLDILKFVTNEETINDKILLCLPSFLNSLIKEFYIELSRTINFSHSDFNDIKFNNSNRDLIPIIIQSFLGPIYIKFSSITFTNIIPLVNDKDNEYFDVLNDISYKNEKSFSLIFLTSILFYKNQIIELLENNGLNPINEFDWELVKFVVEFSTRFYEVSLGASSCSNPVVHMILKWIKVLIIHVTSFSKSPTIGTIKIDQPVSAILQILTNFHNEIENKFDLILSSYLHPSTKRYLKENHIAKVNYFIGSLSNNKGDEDDFDSNDMDDIIMKMFDCSGKATKECYNYETSATSEIKYSKSAKYLSKESGSYILQFWNNNQDRYTTLSSLSKHILSIQLSTDRNFESFKNSFSDLKKTCYLSQSPCDIQAIYFLHKLSKTYDIQSFDPKNFELDIEDYRIDNNDYIDIGDNSSVFSEVRLDGSDSIELTKRLKK